MEGPFTHYISDDFSPTEKRRIARELIAKSTQTSFEKVVLSEVDLSGTQEEEFRSLVKRINDGEPLQYVTGSIEFCGLELNVDNRVLIPRPETEELVHMARSFIESRNSLSVLDIGSGSGCISLGIKYLCNHLGVTGIDVSDDALAVARANSAMHSLDVEFLKIDALSGALDRTFDMIISNPPYVLESDRKSMSSTVFEYEPGVALFVSDNDPLLFYKSIADRWMRNLNLNGVVLLEVHQDLAWQVADLFNSLNFGNVEVRKDFYGNDRFIVCA